MKTGTKFIILLLAVLLTFVGFSMMVSSSVGDMIKLGNDAGHLDLRS